MRWWKMVSTFISISITWFILHLKIKKNLKNVRLQTSANINFRILWKLAPLELTGFQVLVDNTSGLSMNRWTYVPLVVSFYKRRFLCNFLKSIFPFIEFIALFFICTQHKKATIGINIQVKKFSMENKLIITWNCD